jgi:hypothetical protein
MVVVTMGVVVTEEEMVKWEDYFCSLHGTGCGV